MTTQLTPIPNRKETLSDKTELDRFERSWLQSVIGTSNSYSSSIRYGIDYSVSRVSADMGRPTVGTRKAVKRILSYLFNTSGFKLGDVWGKENVYQYSTDSDHSGDQPKTVRSQSGVMLRLNGVPVQYRCSG